MVLNELKAQLGLGARTNKYKVAIHSPIGGLEKVDLFCKTANMPGRSFADISVWVQGRLVTIAGDAQYEGTWSATFMDTEFHSLRKEFLAWMDYIDNVKKHRRITTGAPDYMGVVIIQQLSSVNNKATVQQNLMNAYPKSISEITYSDDNSSIAEFTVEFNYSHWE